MINDVHLMFAKYVASRSSKLITEGTASEESLNAANVKRLMEILDTIKTDANMAVKFALSPEEFAGVIDWAKNKIAAPGSEQEEDASMETTIENSPVGEAVSKEEKDLEAAKNLKPKSEETEEEYLARRDSAIKAAISAKEESEEQTAMNAHYNTSHEALDLVDSLLHSPKKYSKADAIKVLTIALDKLHGKA